MQDRSRLSLLRRLAPLLCGATLMLLSGCNQDQYPQSAVRPESDYARWIQDLFRVQMIWVVIIFVFVQGLLIYAAVRFRARPNTPEPKPVHGNTMLEIAWTIAPAVILALIAFPTVVTIYKTQGKPPDGSLEVKAIGHQWWWEFQYPSLGIITADEMHVPVDRSVTVTIESQDVLHSFWFPAVGGKRDAVPNRHNHMWFTASRVGTYPGECMELCGVSHANMRMKLVVEPAASFDAWSATQKGGPKEPDSTSVAAQGKKLFLANDCVACHTIQGVSPGILGPNLTHVGSRTTFAGSMFENTPENLALWIKNAPARKPGSLMPGHPQLTPDQVTALVAYLQSLK